MKGKEYTMKYRELREYYEAADDEITKADTTDVRKVRLTLRHLNKLRKKRELSRLENEQRATTLKDIYGAKEE